jgi:hypothetical protein
MMTLGLLAVSLMAMARTTNAGDGAIELTQTTFAEKTKGKNSFVKFVRNRRCECERIVESYPSHYRQK